MDRTAENVIRNPIVKQPDNRLELKKSVSFTIHSHAKQEMCEKT